MRIKELPENLHAARAVCAAMLLMAFSGCGSAPRGESVEQAARDEQVSEFAGSGSELVFSGLGVQQSAGFVPSENTLLAARNDHRLAPRGNPSSATRLAYPERGPRSLDQLRVIYLQTNPNRVQYYRDDERRRW